MTVFCRSEKFSLIGIVDWVSNWGIYFYAIDFALTAIWLTGLFIVFGLLRKEKKPVFIWVLWTLISVLQLIVTVRDVLSYKSNKALY